MDKILQSVKKCAKGRERIVVGVSGGADSMVLLDALIRLKKELGYNLFVCHVEHAIRKDTSTRDAKFVEDFCAKNNVDCKVFHIDVPKIKSQTKQTLEQCAREERYKIFYKNLTENSVLFLAHHKNDQAETVLMHILRGSGIDGASGMSQSDTIFRPLIDFSKQQIVDYAQKNNIEYLEDETNSDINYTRNYIRHKVLPIIEKVYPSAVDNICRFASIASSYSKFVNDLLDADAVTKNGDYVMLKKQVLSKGELVASAAIKRAYRACGQFADLEYKHIMLVIKLSGLSSGATINLPHKIVVENRKTHLYFYKKQAKNTKEVAFSYKKVTFGGYNISISKASSVAESKHVIDITKVPKNSVWRTMRQGDFFAKFGGGTKSLSDYFTDKKIPHVYRQNIVVLASGSEVLVVLGYDISQKLAVQNLQNAYKIEYTK